MPLPEIASAPILEEEHTHPSAALEADSLPWNIDVDWVAVGLSLLAVIAVGGLIPFWMWVYFSYHSPIK